MMNLNDNTGAKEIVSVTDAQTKITEIITKDIAAGTSEDITTKSIAAVIIKYLATLKTVSERKRMQQALVAFSRKEYYCLKESKRIYSTVLNKKLDSHLTDKTYSFNFMELMGDTPQKAYDKIRPYMDGTKDVIIPIIEEYQKKIRQSIKAMSVDPIKIVSYTTKSGKNIAYTMPARNRAEMLARYEANIEDFKALKNSGVKLVWITSHPNCSPRCKEYQGKLYSLDGSSGTINGIKYESIEIAFKGPYKDGNGCITGYNCRHRLVPYDNSSSAPIDYTENEINREYAIDSKQRSYENNIRHLKVEEKLLRAAGMTEEASKIRLKWRITTKKYEIFSLENGRATYPWRCVVTSDELKYINKGLTESSDDSKIESQLESSKSVETKPTIKNIPPTLKNFKEKQEKWLSNPANHKFNEQTEKMIERHYKTQIDNNSFGMRVKSENIMSIINDGVFKNQFETNTTGGILNHPLRRSVCEYIFGCNTKDFKPQDFEKYGYLCKNSPLDDFNYFDFMSGWYGDVCIRFKKDNLIDRTTFTTDDSLDEYDALKKGLIKDYMASSVSNPSFCAETKNKTYYTEETDIEEQFGKHKQSFYLELQYHGKLLLDDVESISFDCTSNGSKQNWSLANELAPVLAKKGIIAYKYILKNNINKLITYNIKEGKWIE